MITLEDLTTKSKLELIQILINDCKDGNVSQLDKLNELANAGLITVEKNDIENILNDLIQYCENVREHDSNAILILGYLHEFGLGVTQNYQSAISFYEMILQQNSEAMFRRAIIYHNLHVNPINYSAAIELYEKAIALGNTKAMNNRAFMHEKGLGGPINYSEAITLFEQAIALGNTFTMNNRAYMHQNGLGGPVDFTTAARLYRRATEQNCKYSKDSLSSSRHNTFKYHYAMLNNNIDDATNLILNDLTTLNEFLAFDCERVLENPAHLNLVKFVLDHLNTINLNQLQKNDIYCKTLLTIDTIERKNDCITEESTCFKAEYITQLDIQNIALENLMPIMQLTLDVWDELCESFTTDAARIVCQLITRSKELTTDPVFEDLFRKIALILMKNIYNEYEGEKLNFHLMDFSIEPIDILVRFNNLSICPSINKMNEILQMNCISISQTQQISESEDNNETVGNIAVTSNRYSTFNSSTISNKQDIPTINENQYASEYKSGR